MWTIKKKLAFEKQISIYIFTMRKKNLWIFLYENFYYTTLTALSNKKFINSGKLHELHIPLNTWIDKGICKSNVRNVSGSVKIFTIIFLNLCILKKKRKEKKRNTANRNAFLWQILSFLHSILIKTR